VAEAVFSRCCDPKGTNPSDLTYQIEYNYEFLDDAYLLQRWLKEDPDDGGSSTDTIGKTSKVFLTKLLLSLYRSIGVLWVKENCYILGNNSIHSPPYFKSNFSPPSFF
jgi:hypothetical protein